MITALSVPAAVPAQAPGVAIPAGPAGLSAYQLWLIAGNAGSQTDFLAALKGERGEPGQSATAARVPVRAATGAAPAATTAADFLVLLAGPTQVNLETAPPDGTTHVFKDRGSLDGTNAITFVPGGNDTIDGAASLSFSRIGQAAVITYLTGYGWSIY